MITRSPPLFWSLYNTLFELGSDKFSCRLVIQARVVLGRSIFGGGDCIMFSRNQGQSRELILGLDNDFHKDCRNPRCHH